MKQEIPSRSGSAADAISHRVIEAVAEARGVDPLDLPPLHEFVDPDALGRIFATTNTSPRSTGKVQFTMEGYVIVVQSDGSVDVSRKRGSYEITDPLAD